MAVNRCSRPTCPGAAAAVVIRQARRCTCLPLRARRYYRSHGPRRRARAAHTTWRATWTNWHRSPTKSARRTSPSCSRRTHAAGHVPADVLDADERQRFLTGEPPTSSVFFKLLCYGVLAAQPAPEAVVDADWARLLGCRRGRRHVRRQLRPQALRPRPAGVAQRQQGQDHRLHAPRPRRATRGAACCPQPADPDVAVDVLHAASGGALKSRAFWVVREMRRSGSGTTRRSTATATCPTAACASAPCAWAWSTCPRRPTRSPT